MECTGGEREEWAEKDSLSDPGAVSGERTIQSVKSSMWTGPVVPEDSAAPGNKVRSGWSVQRGRLKIV